MATKVTPRVVASGSTGDDEYLDKYLDSDLFDVVRRYGDWELLASHIADGGFISDAMRKYLVDILRGKAKRPNNRPPKISTLLKHRIIAGFVLKREAGGMRTEAAITEACAHFHTDGVEMDRRTVQRALKTWRHRLNEPVKSEEPSLRIYPLK